MGKMYHAANAIASANAAMHATTDAAAAATAAAYAKASAANNHPFTDAVALAAVQALRGG
jgi:hypothetical protein